MNTTPPNSDNKKYPLLVLPDPRLKIKSSVIQNPDDKVNKEVADLLIATMDNAPFPSVGIAAPQIGCAVRLIVVDARRAKRPAANHGLLVLANPEILKAEGKIVFREGCMSVPGFHAYVERARSVRVRGFDINLMKIREFDAEGFEAVVLQHEIDHLDGILFIDRKIVLRGKSGR